MEDHLKWRIWGGGGENNDHTVHSKLIWSGASMEERKTGTIKEYKHYNPKCVNGFYKNKHFRKFILATDGANNYMIVWKILTL